jgi:hypothetical protein
MHCLCLAVPCCQSEAFIDPTALEALELRLVEAGIDGRIIVTDVHGGDNMRRFMARGQTARTVGSLAPR